MDGFAVCRGTMAACPCSQAPCLRVVTRPTEQQTSMPAKNEQGARPLSRLGWLGFAHHTVGKSVISRRV